MEIAYSGDTLYDCILCITWYIRKIDSPILGVLSVY